LPSTIGSAASRAEHGPHLPFDRRFPGQSGALRTPASGHHLCTVSTTRSLV